MGSENTGVLLDFCIMLGCFPNKNSNIHVWLKAPHRPTDSTFKGKRAKERSFDLRILVIQDWVSPSFLMCLIYVWKHCQKGERMDRNQEFELSWKRISKLWWQLITSWQIYKQIHTQFQFVSQSSRFTFRPSWPGSPGGPVTPDSP